MEIAPKQTGIDKYTYFCPAKINLFLYIVGKRSDGYHNVYSLLYPISLYDELILEKSYSTSIICNNKNIPIDHNNIILKTHNILKDKYGLADNFKITLNKNIPVGAGLGGGSSDAACYLKAINKISNLNLSYDEMAGIMAQVGSDTIFFLKNIPQIATSRGEKLHPAPKLPKLYIIIIYPNLLISTKEVYGSKNLHITHINDLDVPKKEYTFDDLKSIMKNDMERAVFSMHKEVKEIVDFLNNNTCGISLMSGSGSTVFAVYPDEKSQEDAYKLVKDKYKDYFIKNVALAT